MCANLLGVVLALAGASSVVGLVNVSTTFVKPESLELVNVIKQDLRKDNDDYVEQLPRRRHGASANALVNPTPRNATPYNVTPHDDGPNESASQVHQLDTRRTANSAHSKGYTYRARMNEPHGQEQPNAKIRTKLPPAVARSLAKKLMEQGYTRPYPKKYMNQDRANKFKMFVQKNQGKFDEYVKNKKMGRENVKMGRENVKMKARFTSSETSSSEASETLGFKVPSPEELDMAPAQGGRIHVMRMKGRLCQRNVIIPEGPKYDSKGKVYLQEHVPYQVHGREYPQTRPPAIVLPRCCNCCRKSVLGCE